MNKLRSDSAFCQLTPEQTDTLEGWLFEARLGYPKVVERLKAEFGLETSLTGVRRFYKRLDVERSAQSLMDAAEMSGLTVEALKSGNLKPAMLLFANKCLFELLRQSPVPIKEVTTLLRAITSAEAHTMRQTIYEREQAELREAERVRKARESWQMTPWDLEQEKEELRQERAARKKAKQEAAEKAAKESAGVAEVKTDGEANVNQTTSPPKAEREKDRADLVPCANPEQQNFDRSVPPHPGPRASQARHESVSREKMSASRNVVPWGEGETTAAVVASDARGMAHVTEPGVRCCGSKTRGPEDAPATKEAGGAWQPSVLEEREYAENRLTPLNAA